MKTLSNFVVEVDYPMFEFDEKKKKLFLAIILFQCLKVDIEKSKF